MDTAPWEILIAGFVLWAGLMTFLLGHIYFKINAIKNPPCKSMEKRIGDAEEEIKRLRWKAPSGDGTCATQTTVDELKGFVVSINKTVGRIAVALKVQADEGG